MAKRKVIPDETVILDYRTARKDEPILEACRRANEMGLDGKQIIEVTSVTKFGVGCELRIKFKQPIE